MFPDADMDGAVKAAINCIFYWRTKSDVCNAGSRLFMEGEVQDEFLDKLVTRAKKLRPGDPLDPKTRIGAIVSHDQMKTVQGYIEASKKEGAELISVSVEDAQDCLSSLRYSAASTTR